MKSGKSIVLAIAVVIFSVGALWFSFVWTTRPLVQTSTAPPPASLAIPNVLAITKGDVEYMPGSKGFYAAPVTSGNYPGVIMIHEWWGLNENIRSMASKLAADGYRVLAIDLYGGKVATTMPDALALVAKVNQADATLNMRQAASFLRGKGANEIASLGWCFGGGQSLQLAMSGENLAATVLYYGTPLVTDTKKLSAITWPVLGIFGDKDVNIPVAQVNQFDAALTKLNITHEIHIYPGVGHAFANPSNPDYAPKETNDAWEITTAFLDKALKVNPHKP